MTMTTSGMFLFFLNTPTRYESVGCDDENFSSLKEYEFTRLHGLHEFCTRFARAVLRDAIKLISHRNHRNHGKHDAAPVRPPEWYQLSHADFAEDADYKNFTIQSTRPG